MGIVENEEVYGVWVVVGWVKMVWHCKNRVFAVVQDGDGLLKRGQKWDVQVERVRTLNTIYLYFFTRTEPSIHPQHHPAIPNQHQTP
jgi:hypothetical protein